MSNKRSWTPLFEGAEGDAIRQAIREIVPVLDSTEFDFRRQKDYSEPLQNIAKLGLAEREAGRAMLARYLSLSDFGFSAGAVVDEYRAAAEEAMTGYSPDAPLFGGLYSGIAGVGWVRRQLSRMPVDSEEDEAFLHVSKLYLGELGNSPWEKEYDLISGFAGIGLFFLEHLPGSRAEEGLGAVLDCLEETSREMGEGLAWFTPPERLPKHQRKDAAQGYYNLGVAHGVPGAIGLLALLARAGFEPGRVRPLLEGSVRWVLSQKLPSNPVCLYPSWIAPGVATHPSRTAWCYGDLGVAATLLLAGRCAGEGAWERAGVELGLEIAARPFDKTGAVDATLCHGLAGNAHIFHRMYQATREEKFAEAARFWLRKTLEFRKPGIGVAGFQFRSADPEGNFIWESDAGFLNGAAGIGLALLAAVSQVEPEWDRCLLLSIPLDMR